MKAFAALSVLGLVVATPAPLQERDVQTVHLTFHGGPASYSMAFPADGKVYQTSMFFFHSSLSFSICSLIPLSLLPLPLPVPVPCVN